MRVNILKEISFKKIDDAIDDYIYETSTAPNFIVMDEDTFTAIKYKCKENTLLDKSAYAHKLCAEYHDIPIAICNILKYGEIEVV
jgi:hypothetical protein